MSPNLKNLQNALHRLSRRIGKFGSALIWPIERFFQSTGQKAVAAIEGVEHLGGGFSRVGRVITWPFRVTGRAIASMASRVLPESVRRRLAAGGRSLETLWRRVGRTLMSTAEALNLDRLVLGLVWLAQPLWRPIAAVGGCFYAWTATRDFKSALWGLPAIVLALPFVFVLGWALVFGNGRFASQYKAVVKEALEEGDYEQVNLYERKLAQLGVNTKLRDYRTALALAKNDELKEAYARMQKLAPTGAPGYASAHYWIIQSLLNEQLGVPFDESQRLIGVHLDHLQSLKIKGPQIDWLRASWLIRGKQLAEAAEVLKPLVNDIPEAADKRMRIHLTLNELEKAREDARSVRAHMQQRKRSESRMTAAEFASWAIAEQILGDPRQYRSVLQAWHEKEPENESARSALAAILRREFERSLRSPVADPKEMAARLLESVELAADQKWLASLADTLYQQKESIPVAESLLDWLQQSDQTPPVVCMAFGASAANAKEWQQAEQFFRRVTVADPKAATAWNNLAWVLSKGPDNNQEQALEAANKAVELSPSSFHCRETRGQILANRKQWQEAIEDLEFAANGLPNESEIHQSLALAYEALGEGDLAQAHRQQIE